MIDILAVDRYITRRLGDRMKDAPCPTKDWDHCNALDTCEEYSKRKPVMH